MMQEEPAFAQDRATAAYYERRAGEYDEWYEGTGVFTGRHRPGWAEEIGGDVLMEGRWFVVARASLG